MPLQMIELEEVMMDEVSDDALEAMKASVWGGYPFHPMVYHQLKLLRLSC